MPLSKCCYLSLISKWRFPFYIAIHNIRNATASCKGGLNSIFSIPFRLSLLFCIMLRTLRHIPLFRICFLQNTLFSFPSKMKNSLKMSCLWLNHETQKPLSIVNKVSCYICCNNCATYHIYTRKPKSTNHEEKLNNLHLFFILVRYSFQLKLFWRHIFL